MFPISSVLVIITVLILNVQDETLMPGATLLLDFNLPQYFESSKQFWEEPFILSHFFYLGFITTLTLLLIIFENWPFSLSFNPVHL